MANPWQARSWLRPIPACIDEWLDRYLSTGPWATKGRCVQQCIGIGPLLSCQRSGIARLRVLRWSCVIPWAMEWRSGTLSVGDGNHRAPAMLKAGWTHCWIVAWCNSPYLDRDNNKRLQLDTPSARQHLAIVWACRGCASVLDLLLKSQARRYLDARLGWKSIAYVGGKVTSAARAHLFGPPGTSTH